MTVDMTADMAGYIRRSRTADRQIHQNMSLRRQIGAHQSPCRRSNQCQALPARSHTSCVFGTAGTGMGLTVGVVVPAEMSAETFVRLPFQIRWRRPCREDQREEVVML